MRGFLKATQPYADEILTEAVDRFIGGRVAQHNSAYFPTAGQVGTECLRLANEQAERDDRRRRYSDPPNDPNLLPPPERTPDEIERVRKMTEQAIANLAAGDQRGDQAAIGPFARANAALAPSMDPDDVRKRLMQRSE